jgi:hypothetical protein
MEGIQRSGVAPIRLVCQPPTGLHAGPLQGSSWGLRPLRITNSGLLTVRGECPAPMGPPSRPHVGEAGAARADACHTARAPGRRHPSAKAQSPCSCEENTYAQRDASRTGQKVRAPAAWNGSWCENSDNWWGREVTWRAVTAESSLVGWAPPAGVRTCAPASGEPSELSPPVGGRHGAHLQLFSVVRGCPC